MIADFDIRIYNDDCLNILQNMEEESVDLCVSDVPYKISSGGGNNCGGILDRGNDEYNPSLGRMCQKGTKHINLSGIFNTSLQKNARSGKMFDYNEIKFSEWLPLLYRVMKQDTHTYLMVNGRNLASLQNEAETSGFEFQQLLVWIKNNKTPNKYYLNACEFILMLRKGNAKNINDMGQSNVLKTQNIIGNKVHPTQKPVSLMKVLIKQSSKEGDIVLDPFMGSGSTGVAAKLLGRKFIGCEIDKNYFDVSEKRINDCKIQTSLF